MEFDTDTRAVLTLEDGTDVYLGKPKKVTLYGNLLRLYYDGALVESSPVKARLECGEYTFTSLIEEKAKPPYYYHLDMGIVITECV